MMEFCKLYTVIHLGAFLPRFFWGKKKKKGPCTTPVLLRHLSHFSGMIFHSKLLQHISMEDANISKQKWMTKFHITNWISLMS